MTVSTTTDWPTSALQAADTAFAALTTDHEPLTLDCDRLGAGLGLPPGQVPLRTLRDWLVDHPHEHKARDAVWRELVLRVRLGGPHWVVAAVGMAMPLLVRIAGDVCEGFTGDPADVDAEVLTGFLEALRERIDLERDNPYSKLRAAALRYGLRLRCGQGTHVPVEDIEFVAAGPRTPLRPYGHPDLLVQRAMALGLVDEQDVQSYIDVRLGQRAIEPIAAARAMSVDALRMRLRRADARIVAALTAGLLTGTVCPQAERELAGRDAHRAQVRAGKAGDGRPGQPTARASRIEQRPAARFTAAAA